MNHGGGMLRLFHEARFYDQRHPPRPAPGPAPGPAVAIVVCVNDAGRVRARVEGAAPEVDHWVAFPRALRRAGARYEVARLTLSQPSRRGVQIAPCYRVGRRQVLRELPAQEASKVSAPPVGAPWPPCSLPQWRRGRCAVHRCRLEEHWGDRMCPVYFDTMPETLPDDFEASGQSARLAPARTT